MQAQPHPLLHQRAWDPDTSRGNFTSLPDSRFQGRQSTPTSTASATNCDAGTQHHATLVI